MSFEVELWLSQNGLAAYGQVFADNHIGMELLPQLTDADLKELGLTVGHKHAFLRGVERLTKSTESSVALTNVDIDSAPPKFAGERKLMTVLFCDIVESTRLSGLIDAEELDNVLQNFFVQCAATVESFGGLLAERKGDGAFCCFGWPQAHEDDPLRAIHAALMMTREMPAIGVPSSPDWRLNVRVGIATGHVVVSWVAGTEIPQIVGETPSLAERLKEACPVAAVVIDPATRRLVGANFDLAELGNHHLKGFDGPVQICQVVAPRAGVTRFEGSRSGAAARRLVGREGDMAMLRSRWKLACNGEGQVVLLTGQAGIGKSRIAAAIAEHAAGQGCRAQLYQCSHLYRNTAFFPLINRIMRDAEIKLSDKPGEKLKKLYRLPPAELAANEDAMGLYASLLSIPAHEGFVPPAMSPDDWRLEVFNTFLEAISRLGAQKPLLLIVEDVHWIDPTSLELLDAIVERSLSLPILVLMTSREGELIGRWNHADNFTDLQLNRLSPSQSREFCADVVGNEAARKLHLEQIVKAAQGVPLFLEELAKHAQEVPAGESAERGRGQDTYTPIPDHLFSFLAERLDLLDVQSGAKRVAQTAAVFGHEFSAALLAKVPSLEWVGNMITAVDQLLEAGLVVKSEGAVQGNLLFRHSIFREVAYASLLRSTRRHLHEEIATVLVDAGVAEAEPDVVAHHFTEAQKPAEAIGYWTRAGLRSNERSATVEAFSHFSKGLELIGKLPEEPLTYELELPLRIGFGGAASAIEGYSSQGIEKNYARMLELATILNRPRESFRAHLGLGAFYEVGGNIEKSRLHCEECLRSAGHSGEQDELLHAHRLMGELNFFEGEFESSCRHFDVALSLYDQKDHLKLIRELGDDPAVLSRMYNALSLWFLGFPDQAKENCSRGLQLAAKLGHAFTSAQADFYASWLYAMARDLVRARSFAEKAIDRSAVQQFALVLGCSRVIKGWAMARMNEQVAGEEDILQGMALIRGPNADICESSFLTFLADYHLITGNVEKGLSVIAESQAVAAERFAATDRLRLQGELLARQDAAAAECLLREAIATARRQKSLSMELRSALSLYRLLDRVGRTHEGTAELKHIYSRFTEGFETADLKEAGVILKAGSYASCDA
jgi:class 3 adenylate cyclase/tetratricopeptide (TPR) repeat protein